MVRPAGSDAPFTEVELVGGGSSGFLPLGPASDELDEAPACPDGQVLYRTGTDQPFQALTGRERLEAISTAIDRGIITGHRFTMEGGAPADETVTVRFGGYPNRFMTQNEDGTYRLNLGDLVFPKVMPSGDIGMGDIDTLTFRIAPAPGRVIHRARLVPGDGPAFGFGAGGSGGVITHLSSEIRMTPMSYRALVDGMAMLGGDGSGPGGGGRPHSEV